MNKLISAHEAARQVKSGDTVMCGGFGRWGYATEIAKMLNNDKDVTDLIFIFNSIFASTHIDLEQIVSTRCKHVICSFIRNSPALQRLYSEGKLTIVPQGTLAESIRLGGLGIPAFYCPVGVGTPFAEGKESRSFDGKEHVLERTLRGQVALLRATKVDSAGNCFFRGVTKNFSSLMALACDKVFVETKDYVPGFLDPELVTVPGILVDGIIKVEESNEHN